MVSMVKGIVTTVAVMVMAAAVSVIKRMIIASVLLMPKMSIGLVMMWEIGFTGSIAIIIMIRSFAIIISVHNSISAAISSIVGIMSIVLRIMDASAEQQRKNDQQCFFSDSIHFSYSAMVNLY